MNTSGAIGVFDSGYGGLTVLKELRKKFPNHDFIYFGDNARAPYGNRSFDVVYQFTLEAVSFLFKKGCPLVILACNTASAKALRTIQQKDLPGLAPENRVLGVIRPSAEILGEASKSGHVGILGTNGTIDSNSYPIELQKFAPHLQVHQQACPMWVPLIENQQYLHPAGKQFIADDVNKIMHQSNQIDTILLACTHYPVLKTQIESLAGKQVNVIAQGPIVAAKLFSYLGAHPEMEARLTKNGKLSFYSSESPTVFNEKASYFFESKVEAIHHSF